MDHGLQKLWLLTIALCWPWICQCYEHFDVECVNTTQAYLYTDLSKYSVTFPTGCSPTVENGNFSMSETCLGDDKIIVVSPKVVGPYHLSGGKFTNVFTVKCMSTTDNNGSNMKTTTNIGVVGVPEHKHLLITQPQVSMYLTRGDPSTVGSRPPDLHEDETVRLGDKLYLVIASPRQNETGVFYLPEHCEASSDSPLNLTIPIWDRLEKNRDCIKEPSLMDKFNVFPNGHKFDGVTYNLAFAPIYTFIFEQMYVHSTNVTYTCSFIVCPASTASTVQENNGRCAERLANDSQCLISPHKRRARRSAKSQGYPEKRKTLSASVQVRQISSIPTSGTSPGIKVVILVAVLVPFIIIIVIIIICLLYSEARRRKTKQQKVKKQFEMALRRRI